MHVAFNLSGSAFFPRKYLSGTTAIIEGVPVVSDGDNNDSDGVVVGSTTAGVNTIGLSQDAPGASTAAQVAAGGGVLGDGNNAAFVTVNVNPDAVWKAKLNSGATEDTALVIAVQTDAQAAGLNVNSTPAIVDQSVVWGYNGANNSHYRFTTAADTVVLAFPNDIAANDEWLQAELKIGTPEITATLTTLLTQVNAEQNLAGGESGYSVFDFQLRDITDDGRNKSFVFLMPLDHAYGNPGIYA